MDYILTTDGLGKQYRHFKALNGLSLHVPKGAIYGFVGRNGAGKTTLIRLVCGLQEPTEGSFTLYGIRNSDKNIVKARRRMGAVVETPSIYLDMTAEDNLKEQYRVLGLPSFDGIPELLKLVGLESTGRKKAKNFSLGMKQRLGIAIALAGDPDFLVLDEPTNGLDPQGIIEMRELILKLNREKQITVLISSHILDELSRLATHYGIIDKGRMVKELSAQELEAACRKCMRVEVTKVTALARVLDGILFIAAIIAIFACFFIGNDYSDGTLRNKLVVGHSRVNIYFSFFLTVCVASVLFLLAHVLAMLIVGLPLSGAAVLTHVELQPWRIMNLLLTAIAYAVIFTLLSMLDSNMARNVVVSLLLAGVLIFAGIYFYGKVSEPEYIQLVTPQSDGSFLLQEGSPNPEYLTGMTRIVYHWITLILPSGSVMLSLDKHLGFDWRNPLCSVVMILLLTVVGISFFKRKNIK